MTDTGHDTVLPEVRLANDIARQFAHLAPDAAAKEIAAHIASFWDPRMRARLGSHVACGGEGLDPLVLAALSGASAAPRSA